MWWPLIAFVWNVVFWLSSFPLHLITLCCQKPEDTRLQLDVQVVLSLCPIRALISSPSLLSRITLLIHESCGAGVTLWGSPTCSGALQGTKLYFCNRNDTFGTSLQVGSNSTGANDLFLKWPKQPSEAAIFKRRASLEGMHIIKCPSCQSLKLRSSLVMTIKKGNYSHLYQILKVYTIQDLMQYLQILHALFIYTHQNLCYGRASSSSTSDFTVFAGV